MEKMISLEKLIPSRAVREQCILENRVFDLQEQATLVWNNPALKEEERLKLLKKILKQAKEDSQWEVLCKQIERRTKIPKLLEKKFYSDEEKQYFKISYRDVRTQTLENEGMLFSDAEKAKSYAYLELADFSLDETYIITKGYLDSTDEICAEFNRRDELLNIYSYNPDSDDYCDNTHFENAYVLLSHPFRNGDFVKTIDSEEIGIFRGCKNEEEYLRNKEFHKDQAEKGYSDFSDVSCTVEYLWPNINNSSQLFFSHKHDSLVNLEFAEIKEEDPHYELMKQAQSLVRGDGSLEMFTAEILKI